MSLVGVFKTYLDCHKGLSKFFREAEKEMDLDNRCMEEMKKMNKKVVNKKVVCVYDEWKKSGYPYDDWYGWKRSKVINDSCPPCGKLEEDKMKKLDPKTTKTNKTKVCSKALHPEFLYPLIDVSEMSIEKGYEPFNWLKSDNNVSALYLIEAAQRHLDKVKLGIDINKEEVKQNGKPCRHVRHAAQVAYNMLMLCLQQDKNVFIDDRQFKYGELK